MTNTILVTVSTGTIGSEEVVVRQLLEKKRYQLLKIRSIFESHVNLRGDHGKQTNHVTQVCRGLYRGGA
jgi:hypothetical protein